MKVQISLHLILVTASLILFVSAFSSYEDQKDTSGYVGDIRYSLLEPAVFMNKHPGWVLLAGEIPEINDQYQQSNLKDVFKLPKLPDARGLFIRSMNIGRNKSTGDTDGDRNIGSSQGDDFLSHDHSYKYNWFTATGWTRLPGGDVGVVSGPKEYAGTVQPKGGAETRPRNITLYTYVKIN